jgi:hypothetical protein
METEGLNWSFLTDRFAEQKLTGFSFSETDAQVRIVLPLLQPQLTFAAA